MNVGAVQSDASGEP